MYQTIVFETAIRECGYIMDHVKYIDKSREVCKVDGRVPVLKYRNVNGDKQKYTVYNSVHWDASGKCFSRRSNVRKRKWDIELKAVSERCQSKENKL